MKDVVLRAVFIMCLIGQVFNVYQVRDRLDRIESTIATVQVCTGGTK